MIRVKYRAADGFSLARKFKSLKGARAFAQKWVGENPEIAQHYAVSDDGVAVVYVEGVSLHELFGIEPDEPMKPAWQLAGYQSEAQALAEYRPY